MKFLLDAHHPKMDMYKKKLCRAKDVPLITYDQGVYRVDFSHTGLEQPIREYNVPGDQLEVFHNAMLGSLVEEFPHIPLGEDITWQYWDMLQNYAEFRKDFAYYKSAYHIGISLLGKSSGRVLDVGIKDSTVVLDMFGDGYDLFALDNDYPEDFEQPDNITCITSDLYTYQPDRAFDIVMCQQVLEHLDRPDLAFEKLKELSSDVVVISIPYGSWHQTQHDPINEERVEQWTSRKPDLEQVVEDWGVKRYVCGYKV